MTDVIESVHRVPLSARALQADWFSPSFLEIPDPAPILSAFGFTPDSELYGSLPHVENGGVQTANEGAIQDPAGSAVGKDRLAGGGASGAIYNKFNDLAPIPPICPGAAIFNASPGEGRRVLHTHSPNLSYLNLKPDDEYDRGRALSEIGNAYYNAFVAFDARSTDLGVHGKLLNLVPVSAAIYGGAFVNRRSGWSGSHLDPTYTLTAIMLAAAQLKSDGLTMPNMSIFYYDKHVCHTADTEAKRLKASVPG